MNTADSEEMARPFKARGMTPTADLQDADIVLMNTCTVRDQAEHRAQSNLGRLRNWKSEKPHRVLIVAGCAATQWGDSIKKRYPYIDMVAPATQIEHFPELVQAVLKERWNFPAENSSAFSHETPANLPPVSQIDPEMANPYLFGSDQTAYVTIMRGCNYTCSYCIVPQVRGREVYRPPQEILSEIKHYAAQGLTEIMLLGQTVNSYYAHLDGATLDFADLLRAVDAVEGVERIRFMSPHPRHMRDRVIEAMRESRKVCRHIHLPAQSGSTRLLQQMNRLYSREDYLTIVQKLRQAMPGLLITTDLIVGYPGETAMDFQESLTFMQEAAFDGLFAFKFSPRPGTPAAQVPDDVPSAEKEDRLQQVLALNKKMRGAKRA
jgi:tRNA-2-methylthio-N6-dimethylallyladenosine synthase